MSDIIQDPRGFTAYLEQRDEDGILERPEQFRTLAEALQACRKNGDASAELFDRFGEPVARYNLTGAKK